MPRTTVPDRPTGTLTDAWRHSVGTGRLGLALRRDYQDSLALVQREIGFRHVRGHGLLSDDLGVHRPYDAAAGQGRRRGTRYVTTYLDQVVDAYLEAGIAPFVELGFMPAALASGDRTVFWWQGNVTPPRDHREWADLVRAVVAHLVDRYGLDEVRGWPIEVWNEPDLGHFWAPGGDGAGDAQEAYFRLYEASAHAVKDVDASLQVGGPALSPAGDDWWKPFADLVATRDVPVDFVSGHAYASGPAQHVPFGTYQTVRPPEHLLERFAAPGRLLAGTGLADVPVHVTEFNTSYRPDNPVHDTAYNAAYLAPVLAAGGDLVDSFAYWTFCDVFEEAGVPASFLHGGFGMLAHRQVKKPTFHLFAFMARLGASVLARGRDHLVTRDDATGRVTVLAWQPVGGSDDPEEPERHEVRLSLPVAGVTAFALRSEVDTERGNAWAAWRAMGRPASPTGRQLDALREAAEPVRTAWAPPVVAGRVALDLTLGRHGVTLVEIDPVVDETPAWLDDRRVLGRAGREEAADG
ncbi:xylan 1,4-beta-xylosidase [Isoptericola cucumis]|uniref:GH39 family glycosyl hydrolase n=1 Tax=Isoptericola cucumis TaxID=1776856 RepID=UPI003208ED34